jgi:hypothetical protein
VPAPPRLPKWIDEAAVADLVAAEMEKLRSDVESLAWTTNTGLPGPDAGEDLRAIYDLMTAESSRGWPVKGEKDAVEAALRGDVEPLANLLRPAGMPEWGIPDKVNSNVAKLSPATWELIVELLTGRRNPKTGKLKGERGPRKKSAEERRSWNPIHDAEDYVAPIAAILSRLYPDKRRAEIKSRASEIAARWRGAQLHALKKHLRRGPRDRRRVSE